MKRNAQTEDKTEEETEKKRADETEEKTEEKDGRKEKRFLLDNSPGELNSTRQLNDITTPKGYICE